MKIQNKILASKPHWGLKKTYLNQVRLVQCEKDGSKLKHLFISFILMLKIIITIDVQKAFDKIYYKIYKRNLSN